MDETTTPSPAFAKPHGVGRAVFYFRHKEDERCYTLEHHLMDAKDEGLTEIELYKALPEKIDGMFWCRAINGCSEEGYCGKQCEDYEPKNGKSGMCRHKGNFHTVGEKVVFKQKKVKWKI